MPCRHYVRPHIRRTSYGKTSVRGHVRGQKIASFWFRKGAHDYSIWGKRGFNAPEVFEYVYTENEAKNKVKEWKRIYSHEGWRVN